MKHSWFEKLLLQVSVQEIHNSMMSPTEGGVLKETKYAENNIIISDSTLISIIPTQLKKMSAGFKSMCGCECCVSSKSIH